MKFQSYKFAWTIFLIAPMLFSVPRPQPADVESRVEALLGKMTLEEKIGQLVQFSGVNDRYRSLLREGKIGSFLNVRGAAAANAVQQIAVKETRLGIPLIIGFDVIHGYRTVFPIPLAEASSWDPALAERDAGIAAKEASASGIRWTFAPMVDIARDARWGRIAEGSGEDPFLGSIMAAARVRGFQGTDLSEPETVVACPKHYVAYGAAEAGRDYNTVDISEKTLREIYLPPFHAAVDAGAGTLMSAFNDLNGIPASANSLTLTQRRLPKTPSRPAWTWTWKAAFISAAWRSWRGTDRFRRLRSPRLRVASCALSTNLGCSNIPMWMRNANGP
jgi:beta-glucosidase